MTQTRDGVDARLRPQPIFVGDVQGCDDELAALLERARDELGDDYVLYVVGDLVNRGPSNLRALTRVRELVEADRAYYVLGNHELSLLAVAAGLRGAAPGDTFDDVLDSAEAADWIEWLRRRPLVVTGDLAGDRFALVHASVHPDWTLEELERRARAVEARLAGAREESVAALLRRPAEGEPVDPDRDALGRLTRCRSVRGDAWSSRQPEGDAEPWHAAWARRGHDYGVVYGHWAMQGLHVAEGLRGLDTGCVHHGRDGDKCLTAWLPGSQSDSGTHSGTLFDVPDKAFWQVPARKRYRPFE